DYLRCCVGIPERIGPAADPDAARPDPGQGAGRGRRAAVLRRHPDPVHRAGGRDPADLGRGAGDRQPRTDRAGRRPGAVQPGGPQRGRGAGAGLPDPAGAGRARRRGGAHRGSDRPLPL
ncbi:MAG: Heat shock protein 60 family co-chaperone GroES, partial [uncultured Corynebacteriales bacterium]